MTTLRSRKVNAAAPSRLGRAIGFAGPLIVLAALAGCTGPTYDVTGATLGPDDYRYRHPILINQQIATLDLPVAPDAPKLSNRMRGNITGFAQKYAIAGATQMSIIVPSHSASSKTANDVARQAASALMAAGVPRRQIDVRTYPAGAEEAEAPVRLAFARVAAHVDGCGQWPAEDNTMWMKTENRSYYNFGCATQQNLAAAVTNPLDLLYPRGMTPVDATRRAVVLGHYEKGENPSGTYLGLDKVDIATGVGGN